MFNLLSHDRQGVGVMGITILRNGPFVTGSVLLTTEARPLQTPVDSDIIARSAGQPPIPKRNVLNCYARGQLHMQRNPTFFEDSDGRRVTVNSERYIGMLR